MPDNKRQNKQKGHAGESLAEGFLLGLGYRILHRNFRHGRAEVDLIATDGTELVIVEVKLRQSNRFGFPEEDVSDRKVELLYEAGYAYREAQNLELPVRFDIIAISLDEADIRHFKNAF